MNKYGQTIALFLSWDVYYEIHICKNENDYVLNTEVHHD